MVQVARDFDALIITDDVYDQLQWPAKGSSTSTSLKHAILPRVVDIDRELDGGSERHGADGFGNAVSSGSFSKIAGPGVRCGWAEGTERFTYALSQWWVSTAKIEILILIRSSGATASGGAPSQMTSTFMNHLLESGALETHIFNTLQPAYARRYRSIMDAIEHHLLPLGVTLPQSSREVVGGYFTWIRLPPPLEADAITRQAKEEENLIIAPGSLFAVRGDERTKDLQHQVRICFSWEDEENLGIGIERLANVIVRRLAGHAVQSTGSPTDASCVVGDYA